MARLPRLKRADDPVSASASGPTAAASASGVLHRERSRAPPRPRGAAARPRRPDVGDVSAVTSFARIFLVDRCDELVALDERLQELDTLLAVGRPRGAPRRTHAAACGRSSSAARTSVRTAAGPSPRPRPSSRAQLRGLGSRRREVLRRVRPCDCWRTRCVAAGACSRRLDAVSTPPEGAARVPALRLGRRRGTAVLPRVRVSPRRGARRFIAALAPHGQGHLFPWIRRLDLAVLLALVIALVAENRGGAIVVPARAVPRFTSRPARALWRSRRRPRRPRPSPLPTVPSVNPTGPPTTPSTPPPATTTAPAPGALTGWPANRNGYTVVLESIPARAGRSFAVMRARAASHAGLAQVGCSTRAATRAFIPATTSSSAGSYSSKAAADRAATAAGAKGFVAAYSRQISH